MCVRVVAEAMEAKGSATLSSGGDALQWWRWSSGKSGAIASSSDGVGTDHSAAGSSSASLSPSSSSSSSSLESGRWQKRTGGASPSSSSSSGGSGPSSPSFFSPTASMLSARGLPAPSAVRKKISSVSSSSASFARSASGRDATGLKKKAGVSTPSPPPPSTAFAASSSFGSATSHFMASSRSALAPSSAVAVPAEKEIAWSLGPSKRRVKKVSKIPAGQARRASLYAPRVIRPIAEEDQERAFTGSSATHTLGSSRPVAAPSAVRFASSSSVSSVAGFAEKAASPKDRTASPASSLASTVSSSSYAVSPLSYAKKDPLANCARAVLQDCLISKRRMERSSMRKRNIDDCVTSDYLNSKTGGYMSKSSECGILSSCSRYVVLGRATDCYLRAHRLTCPLSLCRRARALSLSAAVLSNFVAAATMS